MSLIDRLFAKKPDPRDALRPLWQAIVAEARRPDWYRAGIEDTVTGRFDMVSSAFALVVLRLEKAGLTAETALLTELFVHDMDGQLREFGVGDVIVGKRVGKLMGATGGRMAALKEGLAGSDDTLREAIGRNMAMRTDADANAIANGLRRLAARLDATDDSAVLAGDIAL